MSVNKFFIPFHIFSKHKLPIILLNLREVHNLPQVQFYQKIKTVMKRFPIQPDHGHSRDRLQSVYPLDLEILE